MVQRRQIRQIVKIKKELHEEKVERYAYYRELHRQAIYIGFPIVIILFVLIYVYLYLVAR